MQLPPLQRGTLIRRYKRFLADVSLPDGTEVVAHCPNTGAMTGCAEPGWEVWLSHSDNPKRKLAWTLELVESPAGLICVHSALANRVVAEALAVNFLPSLAGIAPIRSEVRYGDRSRADFKLGNEPSAVYVEVKAVTLHVGDGLGLFPDTVSDRARRHVEELIDVVATGQRGVMIFCALHEAIDRIAPAQAIDPRYARALVEAQRAGVEVYGLGVSLGVCLGAEHITAASILPVEDAAA